MSSTRMLRAVMAAAASVVPTAQGWQAGDEVIDNAAGTIRQIGISGGVRFLRADPLVETTALGFRQIVLNTPVLTAPAVLTVRVTGTVARSNGQVPVDRQVVYISSQAPPAQSNAMAVVTGKLVGSWAPPDVGASDFTVAVLTDATGHYSVDIVASGAGAGLVQIWTNSDVISDIGVTF